MKWYVMALMMGDVVIKLEHCIAGSCNDALTNCPSDWRDLVEVGTGLDIVIYHAKIPWLNKEMTFNNESAK